jgi:hypothetical protein
LFVKDYNGKCKKNKKEDHLSYMVRQQISSILAYEVPQSPVPHVDKLMLEQHRA